MEVEDNIPGLLLSEKILIQILEKRFGKKITHVGTEQDSFRINFDTSGSIDAVILGPDDLKKILEKHYSKKILDVDATPHEEYLIRFHV